MTTWSNPDPPPQQHKQRGGPQFRKLSPSNRPLKISTGDRGLDRLLKGGVRTRSVTEFYGESATGKTQLALQLCLTVQRAPKSTTPSGAVYVATEQAFPLERLMSLASSLNLGPLPSYGQNVHLIHVRDLETQLHILSYQLPALLQQHPNIRLVVIDSIAANFRAAENGTGIEEGAKFDVFARASTVFQLGQRLRMIADTYDVAVVCVNQATGAVNRASAICIGGLTGGSMMKNIPFETPPRVGDLENARNMPALGLSWSQCVNTRLLFSRGPREEGGNGAEVRRQMSVVFSPYLPPSAVNFTVRGHVTAVD
ncbi:DNA repair protein xrcc3 [Irineochytrium annulatum]|nr:DNA repair protein xrcc3 [Irineochytrium annulatum]